MKIMNWMKRVLALATASSLVLGMLTMSVFAAEGDIEWLGPEVLIDGVAFETMVDAVEKVGNEEGSGTHTITLLRDITLTSSLEMKNDMVLDLGGKTLTLAGSGGFVINGNGQQFTIRDGMLAGNASELVRLENGTLRMEHLTSASDARPTLNLMGGNATIFDCVLFSNSIGQVLLTIQGADVTVSGGSDLRMTSLNAIGVASLNGGSLTVENASLTGEAGLAVSVGSGGEVILNSGARVENRSGYGSAVRAAGGTVTVNEGAYVFSAGTAIDRQGDETIHLNGGTFRNMNVYTGANFDETYFDYNESAGEYTFKGTSQAHTHAWAVAESKEATCTETGYEIERCSCGERRTTVLEMIDHNWGGWTDVVPSCTGKIEQTSTCGTCGEVRNRTIEARGYHTWNAWTVTKPATCTEVGEETRTCKYGYCDATETREIKMIPHSWDEGVVTTKPTETEEGVHTYTCTVCETTRTESIPVLGHEHDPSAEWSYDETGHWHACFNCSERVDNAGHSFGVWTVDQEPTCTAAGSQRRECSVCGFAETEEIPATGNHRYVNENDWSSNDTDHWHACADCGYHGDEAPHIRDSGAVTTPATATTAGVRTYRCTVCARVLGTETIPATGSGNQGGNSGYIPSTPSIPSGPSTPSTPSGPSTPAGPTGEEDLNDPNTPLAGEPDEGEEEELNEGDTPLVQRPFLFEDVGEKRWYYAPIKYVFDRELMNGITDTLFDPFTTTSRGMLVTVLYRLDGAGERGEALTESKEFSDIPAGKWYTDPVLWASDKGVVNGYATGAFGPNDSVLREQVAAILYRYAAYKGYDVSVRADLSVYTDANKISGYAKEAMSWAVGSGIIGGIDAVTLAPKGDASRAQIATMLMRFDQLLAESEEQNSDNEAVG